MHQEFYVYNISVSLKYQMCIYLFLTYLATLQRNLTAKLE